MTMVVESSVVRRSGGGGNYHSRMRCAWRKLNAMSTISSSGSSNGVWMLCFTLLALFTNGLIAGHPTTEKEKQGELL